MRNIAHALGRRLPGDRDRPVQAAAAVVSVILWVLYALAGRLPGSSAVTAMRVVFDLGVYLSCLVALAAELRVSRGAVRQSMAAALAAMVLAVVGTTYLETVVRHLAVRPYPSFSDYCRYAIDILLYYALIKQVRVRVRTWHPSTCLDGVIVGVTVVAAGLQFWLIPMLHANAGDMSAAVTSFLYILGDVVLVGVALGGYAMLGWICDRQWLLFSLALAVLSLGDAVLFTQEALSPHAPRRELIDLGMLGATAAVTWSLALPETMRTRTNPRAQGYGMLIAPTLCTAVALMLTTPLARWNPSASTQLIAGIALLCVAVRATMTFREVHALAEARFEVRTDQLTGLLNRRGFEEAVQVRLHNLRPDGSILPGRLLLLDISRFKEINDSLGHESGDKLLAQFATRVRELSPEGHVVARLGGNEFAVFTTDEEDPVVGNGVDFCPDHIAALTDLPYEVDGIALHLSIGASVARYPLHGEDFAGLIRAADLAMTHSKADHDVVEFDPVMAKGFEQSRVVATNELRHALEHDEIVVYYQPKVRLSDELPYGVEALVRWQHPTNGLIFPDTFLPLAEQAGLMPRLTDVVMHRAVQDVSRWHRAGLPLSVSVNLPAAAIMDSNLPARVTELLNRAELPGNVFTVEITEQALLGDRVRCTEVLAALRQTGVTVSIDDYGTGYSSLAYLRELPVDELKLDKSFIFPMSSDPRAAAIVRSTIDLAHSLGLDIVAEGVEDDQTARQLAEYACDTAQGYYFSRPVPADALLEWFHTRTAQQIPAPR